VLAVALATLGLSVGRAQALHLRVGPDLFNPSSLSFVSPEQGWVLGSVPCASTKGCLGMRETVDGGERWSSVTLPLGLTAQVRKGNGPGAYGGITTSMSVYFANAHDGWIYNSDVPILWSTQNGGQTWHSITTLHLGTYGSIFDIESVGASTYMIAYRGSDEVTLLRSATTNDSWRVVSTPALYLPAGGAEPTGSIVVKGSSAWLMVGNDRGVSAALALTSSGKWVTWNGPCAPVGNTYFVPAAVTARTLAVVCTMGGFASPLSKMAPPGAKIMSNWLYFSENGGRSFRYGPELSSKWLPELLASPSRGVLLLVQANLTTNNLYRIERSIDGGQHWTAIYQGGWAYSLTFQSPERGMALVQNSPGKNALLTTVDGGLHWHQVFFYS
jgi:hypothetical protein